MSVFLKEVFSENFDLAFQKLLEFEGEYSNNPADFGGETKFGISKKVYKNLDIKHLSIDDAKKIYWNDYWLKYRCDEIVSSKISSKFFDLIVNVGFGNASTILQRALIANLKKIEIDAIVGTKTIKLVNDTNSENLITAMRSETAAYYRILILKNPKLKIFENGWLRRAYS